VQKDFLSWGPAAILNHCFERHVIARRWLMCCYWH
jgi:hypothetical protein